MKIKWWADAPRNGYMCLVVIWYWYKSTFERFLFRFSLLIGSLEVSGADREIYLCQSEVTSHFCDDTFVGGSMGMPRRVSEMAFAAFWGLFGAKYQCPTWYFFNSVSHHFEQVIRSKKIRFSFGKFLRESARQLFYKFHVNNRLIGCFVLYQSTSAYLTLSNSCINICINII